MPTPLSPSSAYCTATQFLDFVRWPIVADYLSDDGQRLTKAEVLASTRLTRILKAKSAQVDAACMVGKRYVPADLQALTNTGAELLAQLVAGLAVADIVGRALDPQAAEYASVMQALDMLEALNKGERVFPLQEHAEAGLSDSVEEEAADIEDRGSVTYEMRRMLGRRQYWRD